MATTTIPDDTRRVKRILYYQQNPKKFGVSLWRGSLSESGKTYREFAVSTMAGQRCRRRIDFRRGYTPLKSSRIVALFRKRGYVL